MKAILVIDIPKEFENREPYSIEGTLFCHIDDYYTKYRYVCNIGKTKLKPMPQKKNELSIENTIKKINGNETILLEEAIKLAKQKGYNTCIDEILGEKE